MFLLKHNIKKEFLNSHKCTRRTHSKTFSNPISKNSTIVKFYRFSLKPSRQFTFHSVNSILERFLLQFQHTILSHLFTLSLSYWEIFESKSRRNGLIREDSIRWAIFWLLEGRRFELNVFTSDWMIRSKLQSFKGLQTFPRRRVDSSFIREWKSNSFPTYFVTVIHFLCCIYIFLVDFTLRTKFGMRKSENFILRLRKRESFLGSDRISTERKLRRWKNCLNESFPAKNFFSLVNDFLALENCFDFQPCAFVGLEF